MRRRAGEVYEIEIPPLAPSAMVAEDLPIEVVHEDDDLMVMNKAAGVVVHPGAGNRQGTLVNALLHHRKGALSGIGGIERPGIVHRLDKDTSGLMVVAKNDIAHRRLSSQFADRTLSRKYLAVVWGVPRLKKGRIDAPIGRDPKNRQRMAVVKSGKPAATRYEVIETFDGAALVRCELETGRTHQVRVHLAHLGHPLIGDGVYSRRKSEFARQALHASELTLVHPRNGRTLRFKADMPGDMEGLLLNLRAKP